MRLVLQLFINMCICVYMCTCMYADIQRQHCFSPSVPMTSEVGQAEIRKLELNPDLPCGLQGLKKQTPPGYELTRSWDWKLRWNSIRDASVLNQMLTAAQNVCSFKNLVALKLTEVYIDGIGNNLCSYF